MSNITEMETRLFNLDKEDEAGGNNTNWRLKNRFHEEGLDTTKIELQERLEKEILAYGISLFPASDLTEVELELTCYDF